MGERIKVNSEEEFIDKVIEDQEINYESEEEFDYEKIIEKDSNWNNLYQMLQVMIKKLRILYLSFKEEEASFYSLEKRTKKVIKHHFSKNLNFSYELNDNYQIEETVLEELRIEETVFVGIGTLAEIFVVDNQIVISNSS